MDLKIREQLSRDFNRLKQKQLLPDEKPSSKWPNSCTKPESKPFREIVKGNSVMVIVNRGDEYGIISRERGRGSNFNPR